MKPYMNENMEASTKTDMAISETEQINKPLARAE
jgi:hypothetical protein